MLRILITGGAGFIGSHLTALLLSRGNTVIVVDNFSYGKAHFLPSGNPFLHVHTTDLLNYRDLETVFTTHQPDLVFHLAAIHHIPTCEKKPAEALRANVEGTQNVIQASLCSGVKKIIFASSGAVYEIVDHPLLEDETAVVPHDIYSITKATGEHLLRLQAERKNIKAVACRLFNTVGSHETNEHLVPDILKQVKSGKTSISLGNLSPLRSYIHVLDVAEAFATIGLMEFEKDFEILNIGTEAEHSVKDILGLLAEISAKPLQAYQDPERMRKVDRHRQKASLAKTTRLTGWAPQRTLKEALSDAYYEAMQA